MIDATIGTGVNTAAGMAVATGMAGGAGQAAVGNAGVQSGFTTATPATELWKVVSGGEKNKTDRKLLEVSYDAQQIRFRLPENMTIGTRDGRIWASVNKWAIELILAAYTDVFLGGNAEKFIIGVFTSTEREKRICSIESRDGTYDTSLENLAYIYGKAIGYPRGTPGACTAIVNSARPAITKILSRSHSVPAVVTNPPPATASAVAPAEPDSTEPDAITFAETEGKDAVTRLAETARRIQGELSRTKAEITNLSKQLSERPTAEQLASAEQIGAELLSQVERLRQANTAIEARLAAQERMSETATRTLSEASRELESTRKRNTELEEAASQLKAVVGAIEKARKDIDAGAVTLNDGVATPLKAFIGSLVEFFGESSPKVQQLQRIHSEAERALEQIRGGMAALTPIAPAAPTAEVAVERPQETQQEGDAQSRWETAVKTRIAPKILEESGFDSETAEKLRPDLEELLNGALNIFIRVVNAKRHVNKEVPEVGRLLLEEWHDALNLQSITYDVRLDKIFRMGVQSSLISFAEANLPSSFHVAKLTGELRTAGAQFSLKAGDAVPANVLAAVDEFTAKLKESRTSYGTLKIDAKLRKELLQQLEGVENKLSDLRQRIERKDKYSETELSELRQAIDGLVRASCEAEKKQEPSAQERTARALPPAPAEAVSPAPPPVVSIEELRQLEQRTQTELLDTLSGIFPDRVEAICRMTGQARRSLHTIYLATGLSACKTFFDAIIELQERKPIEMVSQTLEAIDILSRFGLTEIISSINKLDLFDRIGRVHELIRAAGLLKADIALSAINKQFGPVSYQGYVLPEGSSFMVVSTDETPLTNGFEADALGADGTLYEFKSMQSWHHYTATYLGQMLAGDKSIYVDHQYVNEALHALKTFNQIRRLGRAVELGIVSGVEMHISSYRTLNPALIKFIVETIPGVRIVQYRELTTPYAKATIIVAGNKPVQPTAEPKQPPTVIRRGVDAIRAALKGATEVPVQATILVDKTSIAPATPPTATVVAPPPKPAEKPATTAKPVAPSVAPIAKPVVAEAPPPAPAPVAAPPVIEAPPAAAKEAPTPPPPGPVAPSPAPTPPPQLSLEDYLSVVDTLESTYASIPELAPEAKAEFSGFIGTLAEIKRQISELRAQANSVSANETDGWLSTHDEIEKKLESAFVISALIALRAPLPADVNGLEQYQKLAASQEAKLKALYSSLPAAKADVEAVEAALPLLWALNGFITQIEELKAQLSDSPLDPALALEIKSLYGNINALTNEDDIRAFADELTQGAEFIALELEEAAGVTPQLTIKAALARAKTDGFITIDWKDLERAAGLFIEGLPDEKLHSYAEMFTDAAFESPAYKATYLEVSSQFETWVAANRSKLEPKAEEAQKPWVNIKFSKVEGAIDSHLGGKHINWKGAIGRTKGVLNQDIDDALRDIESELDGLNDAPQDVVAVLRSDINTLRQRITAGKKPRNYFNHGTEGKFQMQDGNDLIDIVKTYLWLKGAKKA